VKKSNVKRLVEFGCGNGRDTNFFLHADLDVFALDASEEAVQKTCAVGTKTNKARCFVHDVSNELSSELSGGALSCSSRIKMIPKDHCNS